MEKKESIRKKEIRNIIVMITITLLIGIMTMTFFIMKNKNRYLKYNENAIVDYNVNLKENEFYKENTLAKDNGYVSSLIDNIKATFNYNLDFSIPVSYKYSYQIVADVNVIDDIEQNNIYHYSEDLIKKDLKTAKYNLKIKEDVIIDYQKYNEIIRRFKEVYELKNAEANLNIDLYVNVQDLDRTNTSKFQTKKVSTISIPLTQKTVSISTSNNTSNINSKLTIPRSKKYDWILIISLIYIVLSVIYMMYLYIYITRTRTAQMIYEKEIKSIISNYDNYIQKINGSYDIGTSQVIKIESFSDMLEIRDTLKQPILMLENKEKDGTFFIIPATNSIIYTYALRVVDIKAKMDGKEIPTYDIMEIPHSEFKKQKKYTDKYIKEQITMTTALPAVDDKNIIKGNKDKEKDLYDQLEKTRSFDIKEIRKAAKETKKETSKHKKRNSA